MKILMLTAVFFLSGCTVNFQVENSAASQDGNGVVEDAAIEKEKTELPKKLDM